MGVPKFFRYISERYPCLSEVVREHQIPEFDNLYLDMNGIIHVCSHPNDNDPHFRISEENIFNDIFHYIETLFRMIQPKRLFFMAVDGVAPRAKMNQQRGRRFRTAKEAQMQEEKAKANNEQLPDAERFDSNCITPGTVFMARLHAQLRYFVSYKISTDKLWQKPTIILSGHETPGEGEHKIMDYIRYMKSQADYDPNTRHCLYGLDADLIMLGLCTHEPHFALLREEVKFGKNSKDKKRASVPEEIRFYLLHLSLMREYIDLEFQELKTTLPFPYNLENIIDDWVLMGFLVGNDFIPNLPNLHIVNGALPILYKAYKDVLPALGGYINEGGALNLARFQKYMEKLAGFDLNQFRDMYADLKYFQAKTGRRPNEKERTCYKNTDDNGKNEDAALVKNPDLAALIKSTNRMLVSRSCTSGEDEVFYCSDDDQEEYEDDDDDVEDAIMYAEFYQHKNDYYVNKLEYDKVTPEVLQSQAEGYVRAIQWNLNYYYNGCCSWSWFYPHHYAPFISDITNFKDLKLEFDLGEPFLPFQQLLAVLPAASKKLLPEPFQELMVNEDSPIIDFYPADFKTDMNGKKQEWEAVVLIPFINQEALLKAMATKYDRLTDEEKRRNSHGPMLVYNYTSENQGICEAPEYYPTLNKCYAKEVPLNRQDIFVEQSKLVKGLSPGVRLDVYFPGFPTLKHLPFTAELKAAKVKVFEHPSRGENMILTLKENPNFTGCDLLTVATKVLNKIVFVSWPHLTEAKVIAISSENKRVFLKQCADGSSTLVTEDLQPDFVQQWRLSRKAIEETYFNKMGVDCKNTKIVVYACNLEGRKFIFTNTGRVSHEKKWAKIPSSYALQTLVCDIAVKEPEFTEHLTVDDLFKPSTVCFTLGTPHYGAMGTVCEGGKNGRIKLSVCITSEPDLEPAVAAARRCRASYIPGHVMAQRLGISSHLLSRLTGSIFVVDSEPGSNVENSRTNIGLNLKFTKKNEEVCGYTKKENGQWLYSSKSEQLINNYMRMVPDVISYIAKNVCNDVYYASEIFPENSHEQLKKLTSWLNDQDFMKAERLPCGSEILLEEIVSLIENVIDSTKNKTAKTVVMQIKPHLLLLPKTSVTGLCPDANAVHKLFDRIICVRESFTVPLGLKGTIIGIRNAEKDDDVIYDVVFDKEFVGGIQIRCSPNRGYRMTQKGFLNLSHGVRLENHKVKNNASVPVQQSEYDRYNSCPWNIQRNSAFASCSSKSRLQEQTPLQQFQKQKTHSAADKLFSKFSTNSYKHENPQDQDGGHVNLNKPSSEFQAMWNELKKAGTKPCYQGGDAPPPSADASDVLKKMLKIADTSPNDKTTPNFNLVSSKEILSGIPDVDKMGTVCCDKGKPFSFVEQLENYLKRRDAGKPIYTYEYSEQNGQSFATAKLYFEIPPDLEKSVHGRPSVNVRDAAESAAEEALKTLNVDSGLKIETSGKEIGSTASMVMSGNNLIGNDHDVISNSDGSTIRLQPSAPAGHLYPEVADTYHKSDTSQRVGSRNINNNARHQQNNYQHQQPYRNRDGGSYNNSGGHSRMKNAFSSGWYKTDLPTPPQQWYQSNRAPPPPPPPPPPHQHQNNDCRYVDQNQRQDHVGGGTSKQQYHHHHHHHRQQQQQYYSSGHIQKQHHPFQMYQNYSHYQHTDPNFVGQSSVPNWKQIRPVPPMVGVGQTPFIPLQAITQCRTRPSSCSNFISKSTTESNQLPQQQQQQGSIDTSIPAVHQSRPPTVLSQPRKSRIAANFHVKIE